MSKQIIYVICIISLNEGLFRSGAVKAFYKFEDAEDSLKNWKNVSYVREAWIDHIEISGD